MFKKIIFIFCGVIFGLGFWLIYQNRAHSPKGGSAAETHREPRVLLNDFVAYRSTGGRIKSTTSAKIANFFEPNILELHGDVKSTTFGKDGGEEMIASENAVATFAGLSIGALNGQAKLEKIVMTGKVVGQSKDYRIETEYAEYHAAENILQSQLPVGIFNVVQEFHGDSGFRYDVAKDTLDMFGKITGHVLVDNNQSAKPDSSGKPVDGDGAKK